MGNAHTEEYRQRREESLDMAVKNLATTQQHREHLRTKIGDLYLSHFDLRQQVAAMID